MKQETVLVVNTHLEGENFVALQKVQAQELLLNIDELAQDVDHVVLAGDFNLDRTFGTGIYEILVDGRVDPFADANESTFGTDPSLSTIESKQRIDHIFVPTEVKVVSTEVFGKSPLEKLGGKIPSDHFGIMCAIDLQDYGIESSYTTK